jgi:NADPH:quinone reductase
MSHQAISDCVVGRDVTVVYDGVGKATSTYSLDCLAPRGMMVSFGNASGKVPPVELGELTSQVPST